MTAPIDVLAFGPAAQARARAFYARQGWTTGGAPFRDDELALDLVEYRRPVP